MEGVSIIVCCYNSAERLPETIKYLAFQNIPNEIKWEIIIVDNNSIDGTDEVARNEWQIYGKAVPFIIVTEKTQGLTSARERGIKAASFNYLLFCDDDNWLASNYIAGIFDTFQKNAKIAIVGGRSYPVFEESEPNWFKDYALCYAVGNQYPSSKLLKSWSDRLWGAGMAIRKSTIKSLYSSGFTPILSGRKKDKLSSGEDSELCKAVLLQGKFLYYNEQLAFGHFIPKSRSTREYLRKLLLGFPEVDEVLACYNYFIMKKTGVFGTSLKLKSIIKNFIWRRSLSPIQNAFLMHKGFKKSSTSFKTVLNFYYNIVGS